MSKKAGAHNDKSLVVPTSSSNSKSPATFNGSKKSSQRYTKGSSGCKVPLNVGKCVKAYFKKAASFHFQNGDLERSKKIKYMWKKLACNKKIPLRSGVALADFIVEVCTLPCYFSLRQFKYVNGTQLHRVHVSSSRTRTSKLLCRETIPKFLQLLDAWGMPQMAPKKTDKTLGVGKPKAPPTPRAPPASSNEEAKKQFKDMQQRQLAGMTGDANKLDTINDSQNSWPFSLIILCIQ